MVEKNRKTIIGLAVKAFLLSESILLATILCMVALDLFGKDRLADAIFLEGAVLMVIGGTTDFILSLTMKNIRNLLTTFDPNALPLRAERSAGACMVLLSGIFLCVQAFLFVPSCIGMALVDG